MKKLIISIILVVSILFLYSCSLGRSRIAMLNKEDEGKTADARFEQVVEAIKDQDKEALKSIFSEEALDETKDIDGGIDYLLGFIQGDIKSWENIKWSSGDNADSGNSVIKEIRSWYKVSTDKNEYLFFLLDYSKDTENPDNVGLYTLRAIKAVDKDTQFIYWQDMKIAGIYKPEE